MSQSVDFIFLNEQDMIDAGVMNTSECINEMEEVFKLLSDNDYRMGGKLGNSHGIVVNFPDEPEHEGMPKNGPDRRFCAMPAYLGGKYRVAGCKWYGSNIENKEKGLPRSILMMTLNNADTGAPLAYMSANLLSAWRTGAIPGVGVRYLAKEKTKVVSTIGAGAIGTSSLFAILDELKTAEVVKIFDVYEKSSEALKEKLEAEFKHVDVQIVNSIEEAVVGSDVISIATAGNVSPEIKSEWIEKSALFVTSGSATFDPDFATKNIQFVVDNWQMYEEVKYEDEYPYNNKEMGVVGRLLLDWIHEDKMTTDNIKEIGDVINGKVKARDNEDDIVVFALGGQPVYDVAWAYNVYQNALENNIGTKLNLWDVAYQAR